MVFVIANKFGNLVFHVFFNHPEFEFISSNYVLLLILISFFLHICHNSIPNNEFMLSKVIQIQNQVIPFPRKQFQFESKTRKKIYSVGSISAVKDLREKSRPNMSLWSCWAFRVLRGRFHSCEASTPHSC